MENNITKLYERFRIGDPLSDEELKLLHEHAKTTVDNLSALGPVFHIARSFLLHDMFAMESFMRNREMDF